MSWAHKGDKVRFLARNGYDSELSRAKGIMKPGAILTVAATQVHSSSSDYIFDEITGRWNTVMFEIVPEIEIKPLEWVDVKDNQEFRAATEFGVYRYDRYGWTFEGTIHSSSQPKQDAQADYDRRVQEAHVKAEAAKSGLGMNDVWMTLTEIMGDKTPFLPLWAMMELNKRLNDKYFGGSLPSEAQEEIDRLKERLSIDPQGGDWIDVLEDRINDLEAKLEKANQDADDSDKALQELIEHAYDGDGEKFVIKNYPTTCAEIVKKRHDSAIKPGIYVINYENGISFKGLIYTDSEGHNWIASPFSSSPVLFKDAGVASYHPLYAATAPA